MEDSPVSLQQFIHLPLGDVQFFLLYLINKGTFDVLCIIVSLVASSFSGKPNIGTAGLAASKLSMFLLHPCLRFLNLVDNWARG